MSMKESKGGAARTFRVGPAARIGSRRGSGVAKTHRVTGRRGLYDLLDIYRNLSGFHVGTLGFSQYPTAYGEVTEKGIQALSATFQAHAPGQTRFVDVGCGIGRAVLGMAVLHPTLRCSGIEIVPERVRVAHQALERVRVPAITRRIQIQQGDCLGPGVSFATAGWVFVSNTMFDDATQAALAAKFEAELPVGAVVICSKQFPVTAGSPLQLVETGRSVPMSWSSSSTCSVYKKIAAVGKP